MSQNHLLNQKSSLTPEDQFLLELLVDGELDDPNRRDLLLRLDRLPDGWRCCAVAFLEAQCLKESFGDSLDALSKISIAPRQEISSESNAESDDSRLEQTVFVSVRDIPDHADGNQSDDNHAGDNHADVNSNDVRTVSRNLSGAENPTLPDHASFTASPSDSSSPSAAPSSGSSHLMRGNTALDYALHPLDSIDEDSTTESADNPFIIPIRKGGHTSTRLGRRLEGGLSRAGLSWRSFAVSASCGFLLAAALGVLFGRAVWRDDPSGFIRPQDPMSAETRSAGAVSLADANIRKDDPVSTDTVSKTIPNHPATKMTASARSGSPPTIVRPEPLQADADAENSSLGFYVADLNSDPSEGSDENGENAGSNGTSAAVSAPIRQVTLRRSPEDSGISVPCVEAESYDPNLLRRSPTNAYVKDLQKGGCQVETVYEELRFPLQDGRTLIVPVDTINVQRPTKQNFQ